MSTSMKKIREQQNDDSLIITPYVNEWLLNEGDTHYSQWVLDKLNKQLSTPPRDRSGSFSSSAAGYCERRQVLGYLGVEENVKTMPQLQLLFNDGKWRHLRWQAMLLEGGILTDIEVGAKWPEMRSVGSMDGFGNTGDMPLKEEWKNRDFGFELKGMHPNVFAQTKKAEHIPPKHNEQVQRYMLQTGLELFVYVAEDKATQEWVEYVIEVDPNYRAKANAEIARLNEAVNLTELPPRLAPCQAKLDGKKSYYTKGFDSIDPYTFSKCPYGKSVKDSACLKIESWDDIG